MAGHAAFIVAHTDPSGLESPGLRSRSSQCVDGDLEALLPFRSASPQRDKCQAKQAPAPESAGRQWAVGAICCALVLAFCGVYAGGLQGSKDAWDLNFMKTKFHVAARCELAAVVLFTAAAWLAGILLNRWRHRLMVWGALVGATLVFLAADHGADFQHHGHYNFLGFWLLAIPINLLPLALRATLKRMHPRHAAYAATVVFVSTAVAVLTALLHYEHVWGHGFYGRSMVAGCSGRQCGSSLTGSASQPLCNFPPNTPWLDLLPQGTLNFWTGRQTCKPVQGFQASFGERDGLLTIQGCPQGHRQQYTPLPTTREWGLQNRTHTNAALQAAVLASLKPVKYTGAVRLRGVEAVLVRCGEAERLLVRVEPLPLAGPPQLAGSAALAEGMAHLRATQTTTKSTAQQAAAATVNAASSHVTSSDSSGAGAADERLNVLVIFVDAMSRRHFFRRLQRSRAALEALPHGGVTQLYQFFRYHIVGINTAPNSHAMYTGTPFPTSGATPVWQSYRRVSGYVTGSAYNLCEGWGAEYNNLTARHDHELLAPFCLPEYHPLTTDGKAFHIFQGAYSIRRRCLRGQYVHQYNFDYMRSFMRAYGREGAHNGSSSSNRGGSSGGSGGNSRNSGGGTGSGGSRVRPWFLISTFHEAHEATGEVLHTMDAALADFFTSLTPAQLNSTVVLLLGDHGLHMGFNFIYTRNGAVEHANPFMAMLAPAWLQRRHPVAAAALAANEQRLVTAYDVFTTLHHILHLHEMPAAAAGPTPLLLAQWAAAGDVSKAVRWGTSLLAPVPANRTCDEAGVPPKFCKCT